LRPPPTHSNLRTHRSCTLNAHRTLPTPSPCAGSSSSSSYSI
jgi:hypothetical protein